MLFAELTVEDLQEEWFQEGIEKGERIGLEKGERIGLEKGERVGLEKGERIGLDKGKLETAFKMLAKGFPIDAIIELTDLDISVLEKAINQRSLPD